MQYHICSNLFHLEIYGYDFNAASVESLITKHRFIKGIGMIRAEIGLQNRQIINETYSFRRFLIL